MRSCRDFEVLLQGFIDKELTVEEQAEVNGHLIRCASCRESHEQMVETLKILDAASFQEPEDAALEAMWRSPVNRVERTGGLVLVIGGYLSLIGYAIYQFMFVESGPPFPKVASAAIFLGFFLVFVSVLREQLAQRESDRYKEIKR